MAMAEAMKVGRLAETPVSKPAPTQRPYHPPAHSHKVPFDLASSANHIPAHIIKLLKTQLSPLAETSLPDPQDLTPFWGSVSRALLSLDASFAGYEWQFK
jgi:hypothetical protein